MSLRAIDALFAENVAGCKVGFISSGLTCMCARDAEQVLGPHDNEYGHVEAYTSLLDATWPVVAGKMPGAGCIQVEWDYIAGYNATITLSVQYHAEADSPALALVLAALRAAGVPEEEIQKTKEE